MPAKPVKNAPELVSAAADLMQRFNHLTLSRAGLPNPPRVADTVLNLTTMIDRLPQSIEQINNALVHQSQTDRIRMDNDTAPDEAAAAAIHALEDAAHHIEHLSSALHCASSTLAHMAAK